jgi:hypothetical protein
MITCATNGLSDHKLDCDFGQSDHKPAGDCDVVEHSKKLKAMA